MKYDYCKSIVTDYYLSQVLISLLLQLCFSILLSLALFILTTNDGASRGKFLAQRQKIAIIIVEFHKNQCYIISAILIAMLPLLMSIQRRFEPRDEHRDGRGFETEPIHPGGFLPVLPFPVAFAFSMSGLVPTTLAMSLISRHARLTWHIIILTIITFVLSTTTLGISTRLVYFDRHRNPHSGCVNGPCDSLQRNVA